MQEEVTIRREDLQPILAGQLDALEQFLLRPNTYNQATTNFILEQTALALLANPKNHCAMTLDGFIRLMAIPANSHVPDLPAALRSFEQAAAMDNPFAITCAADCYANAKGTAQDLLKAAKYYRKALKIVGEHAKTKADFSQMVRRFKCSNEVWYHYHIAMNEMERLQGLEQLCLLYNDRDPAITKELKVRNANIISPLREDLVFNRYYQYHTAEGILIVGMIACWEAEACPIDNIDQISTKIKFAVKCVEALEKLEEFPINQLILRDTIELIQARWMLEALEVDDPQNIFDIVEKLMSIKTIDESYYRLADLVMRLNTENIFINHKDKYRLIIGLLSRVDEATRLREPGFYLILKNAIASLKSIQTAADFSTPDDTIYIRFEELIKAVPGLRGNSKLPYSPRLEYELTNATKAQQHITEKFGPYPIQTFEQLIYQSYADCYEQLDLDYLHERLLQQLQSRILPKKVAVEELIIDSGNAGLGRKRHVLFSNKLLATDMHMRDLALKAIEIALADFNVTTNSTGFFAVAFKVHYKAAKQLQEKCIGKSNFYEIFKLIVTYLKDGPGKLDKGWFKMLLLMQLTQALNFGNIKLLDTEPDVYCKKLCETLLQQCEQQMALESAKNSEANNNNM